MGASEGDKMYEELADMKKLRNVLSEVNTLVHFLGVHVLYWDISEITCYLVSRWFQHEFFQGNEACVFPWCSSTCLKVDSLNLFRSWLLLKTGIIRCYILCIKRMD